MIYYDYEKGGYKMRFELLMNLEKNEIDKDYRRVILSFLKAALKNCNLGKYYDSYYKDTIQKDFCFSVIMPNPVFGKEKITLSEPKIRIIFSCADKNNTGLIFYSAFLEMKNREMPLKNHNSMKLSKLMIVKELEIQDNTVYFKTVAGNGLCIREHDRKTNRDRFVTCNDEDFEEKVTEILKLQLKNAGFSESRYETLTVEPVRCKKVLVYHYGIYVDTTVGIFKISGDSKILQYLYKVGFGSKHSAGFGMMNIIAQGE